MRTFAFIPGQVNKVYSWIISKYKRYDSIVELFKVSALWFFLLLCGFAYLYFVNMSSTRGYFLRQENQNLSNVSFKYEILKTQLLEQKLRNRGVLDGDASQREMVVVPIDPISNSWIQIPIIKTQ